MRLWTQQLSQESITFGGKSLEYDTSEASFQISNHVIHQAF